MSASHTLTLYQNDASQHEEIFTVIYIENSSFRICKAFPEIWMESPGSKARNERRVGKFAIFNQQVAVFQKRCEMGPRLLLITNTTFRLPPKSTTLDDLERPYRTLLHKMMRLSERITEIWNKIDAYYQRQKCSPWTLLSSGIRFTVDIRGVPWGLKRLHGGQNRRFVVISIAVSSELVDLKKYLGSFPATLKWFTLNDSEMPF